MEKKSTKNMQSTKKKKKKDILLELTKITVFAAKITAPPLHPGHN